jgi:multiple antibiotic resistance protein
MHPLLEFTVLSFSATFVIVDPLGIVPIFVVLTPNDSAARRRQMARRACLVAWALLVAFAIGGSFFFKALGVTLSAFKIAGGLVLLLTGIDQLRAQPVRTRTTVEEQSEGISKEDISIVPLAMPLLAGPGSIATAVMLTARAHGLWEFLVVLLAITVTLGSAFLALLMSDRIERLLGTTGRLLVERLGGLVLASIAVQFVIDGAKEALHQ